MTTTAPSIDNPLGFVMLNIILGNGRLAMATTSVPCVNWQNQKSAEHLQQVRRRDLIGQEHPTVDTTFRGETVPLFTVGVNRKRPPFRSDLEQKGNHRKRHSYCTSNHSLIFSHFGRPMTRSTNASSYGIVLLMCPTGSKVIRNCPTIGYSFESGRSFTS
jgi:hypothetical protein